MELSLHLSLSPSLRWGGDLPRPPWRGCCGGSGAEGPQGGSCVVGTGQLLQAPRGLPGPLGGQPGWPPGGCRSPHLLPLPGTSEGPGPALSDGASVAGRLPDLELPDTLCWASAVTPVPRTGPGVGHGHCRGQDSISLAPESEGLCCTLRPSGRCSGTPGGPCVQQLCPRPVLSPTREASVPGPSGVLSWDTQECALGGTPGWHLRATAGARGLRGTHRSPPGRGSPLRMRI